MPEDLDNSSLAPVESIDSDLRGDFLGYLASHHAVYDRKDSHLAQHPLPPEVLYLGLKRISWDDSTPTGENVGFSVEMSPDIDLGKSAVAPVPDRFDVEVFWAPRLKPDGSIARFRTNDDGQLAPLYSRWVRGLRPDEIPDNNSVRLVLQRPLDAREPGWLRLTTAYPTFGDSAREIGENFKLYPNPAAQEESMRYWLGIDAYGNQISRGHAFVYDPDNPQCDLSMAIFDNPYQDTLPYLTSQTASPRVAESVYSFDRFRKALTGRTPERIAFETGISKDVLFPPDMDILYIGDPWQRMGLEIDSPRLTIIDYEYGETAAFISDDNEFFERVHVQTQDRLRRINDFLFYHQSLSDSDREWVSHLYDVLESAVTETQNVRSDLSRYYEVADIWHSARRMIEDANQKVSDKNHDSGDRYNRHDELSTFRYALWYDCVYGERGLRDLYDYHTIILPKVEAKRAELASAGYTAEMIDKHIDSWVYTWINEIRLHKKPTHANVVVGVFPELPFQDQSFDRVIASWSISAHTFAALGLSGFMDCWNEAYRVLKHNGEAYFFPISYSDYDQSTLGRSLEILHRHTGADYSFLNADGHEVDGLEDTYTLRIVRHA